MSRFLETSQFLRDLNALWDEHEKHVSKANVALNTMLSTAGKIPSKYISVLNTLADAQNRVIQSSNKLSASTRKNADEVSKLAAKKAALTTNVKQLGNAVDNLEKKLAKATSQLASLQKQSASAASSQGNLTTKINAAQNSVNTLTSRLTLATGTVSRFGTAATMSFGMMGSLMGAFGIGTGIYLFAQIAKSIFNTTRELESLDLALKNVTGSQAEFLTQQQFLNSIAEKYGLEIKGLTKQYTQWYVSAKEKLKEQDIQNIFESIANAGANMGLTIEKQNSAFLALEQMMSKGTVQAEELKRQLGNALPGAFEIMVKTIQKLNPELEVTQNTVIKMMKEGKIMAAEVLPEFARQMEIAYGIENQNRVETLNSKINRLSSSWTNFVRDITGSRNRLGAFFGWFADKMTQATDYWGEFLKSGTDKKMDELDKMLIMYEKLAKANLQSVGGTDADKQMYADNAIDNLMKEKEGIMAVTKAMQEQQKALDITRPDSHLNKKGKKFENGEWIKEYEQYKKNIKEFDALDEKIAKRSLNPRLAEIDGLIAGYMAFKVLDGSDNPDEDDKGGKHRREKVALTFDWIKAEYELKKAIIERQRAEYAHNMDNENKTLAERLDARSHYAAESLKLLVAEWDEEKALNSVRYLDDIEKNKTALKNKDITAKQYYKNIQDLNKRVNFENQKADENYSQKWQQLVWDNFAFAKKLDDKRIEYTKRLTDAEYKNYVKQTEDLMNRKNVTDDEFIKLAVELRDAEVAEAAKTRDEKLKLAGNEAILKEAIWAEYGNNVAAIDDKLNDNLEKNRQRRLKREKEIKDLLEDAYDRKTIMGENLTGYLGGANSKTKKQFETLVKNYKIAVAEGDEAIIDERKRQLDDFIEYIKSVNEYAKGFFDDFANNSGFKTLFDIFGKKIKGFGKDWKTTFLAMTEVTQEAYAMMHEANLERIENDKVILQDQYDYNMELAGDNVAAQEDLTKRMEVKKRELARREAKEKREAAMFNIGIDAAQAIIGLWVNPGFPAAIPLAVMVGALAAVQMATVASKPLPSYFTGVENASEGHFANVDERGAEMHLDRFGRIKDLGSEKGSRVKYIAKGDTIIPAHKTKDILTGNDFTSLDEILFNNDIQYYNENNNKLDASGIINSIESLKHTIENKETSEEIYDVRGHRKYRKIRNQRIEDKNNRIRFKKSIL